MIVPIRRWAWIILLAGLYGCSRTPASPVDTGAKEVVRDFYEGLLQQDWQRSYGALHPDYKKGLTAREFTRLSETYRSNLGFNPEELHVQSCEEKGTEAVAHVVLTGRIAAKQRRYKDAVVLRQSVEGWRIILPNTFGRTTR